MEVIGQKVYNKFAHLARITSGRLPGININDLVQYEDDWRTVIIDKGGAEMGQAIHIVNPLCIYHPQNGYPKDEKKSEELLKKVGCYNVFARLESNFLIFPGKSSHLFDGKEWVVFRDIEPIYIEKDDEKGTKPIHNTKDDNNFPLRYLSIKPSIKPVGRADVRCVGKLVDEQFPQVYQHCLNVDKRIFEISGLTNDPICLLIQDNQKTTLDAYVI